MSPCESVNVHMCTCGSVVKGWGRGITRRVAMGVSGKDGKGDAGEGEGEGKGECSAHATKDTRQKERKHTLTWRLQKTSGLGVSRPVA